MSSWISRATSSHNAQLITTAIVSGIVVGSTIFGVQKAIRMYRVEQLKESIPDIGDEHHALRVCHEVSSPHIIAVFSYLVACLCFCLILLTRG